MSNVLNLSKILAAMAIINCTVSVTVKKDSVLVKTEEGAKFDLSISEKPTYNTAEKDSDAVVLEQGSYSLKLDSESNVVEVTKTKEQVMKEEAAARQSRTNGPAKTDYLKF